MSCLNKRLVKPARLAPRHNAGWPLAWLLLLLSSSLQLGAADTAPRLQNAVNQSGSRPSITGYAINNQSINSQSVNSDTVQQLPATTTPTPTSNSNAAPTVHAQLTQIITSADYAKAQQRKVWQRKGAAKADSWLLNVLLKLYEFLFGNRTGGFMGVLALLLKIGLVLALLALIAWIAKNAGARTWLTSLRRSLTKRPSVSQFEPSVLAQSWERLPAHALIPQTVAALMANHEFEQAASVLYCASLRWLTQTHHIAIAPATTEKQCLSQVRQIAQIAQAGTGRHSTISSTITPATANYIETLIYLWLEVAYSTTYKTTSLPLKHTDRAVPDPSTPQQSLATDTEAATAALNADGLNTTAHNATALNKTALNNRVSALIGQWLLRLPLPTTIAAHQGDRHQQVTS